MVRMFYDRTAEKKDSAPMWGALLLTALLSLALACSAAGGASRGDGDTETVTGTVRDVQASSFSAVDTLTVADGEGKLWVFEGRGKAIPQFSPSHLRDHMLLGTPVVVQFHRDGEALVIDDIDDAAMSE